MAKTIIDFNQTIPVAKNKIFNTADSILRNRHPQFWGENKEYVYVSSDNENWTIKHIMIESIFEKKEIVLITGWKKYEDLGVMAVIIDYDGINFAVLDTHPIVQR